MKSLVLFLLLPLSALAAPKVTVLPFTGPKANASRDQIVSAICDVAECVPQSKVTKKNKLDPAKAKKEKLQYVVSGKVAGKKVTITVQTLAKKNKLNKGYAIGGNGKLSGKELSAASFDVQNAIGASKKEEKEEKEETQVKEREETHAREEKTEEKVTERPSTSLRTGEKPPPEEEKKSEEKEERREEEEKKPEGGEEEEHHFHGHPPVAIVQLGTDITSRFYSYNSVETANLRSYRAYLIFMPRLHGEVYPLAKIMDGPVSGLGAELDYAFAVGLQSSPTGGPNYPTKLSRLDVALRMRLPIGDEETLVVNPFVGYRAQSFGTNPAPDGSKLVGLANIDYTALRIGASVEQSLLDDKASVYGQLALLPLLGTGALKDYFPKSSGFGFEVGVGGGYKLVQKLELRVGLQLTRYGLGFTVAPTDTYRAAGASDLYAGVNVGIRWTF